ncbi:NB-ARC domain-containing protein [Lentzea kentuckyensis]|uniref:NB-ARC domain-containing protein n=1 Tax=Lentzea kentuckyensis TaxID=360086 RepID=UPI000A3A879D|nr:NB-ARC domain-containing protein [Lentzea kentuckyensis]
MPDHEQPPVHNELSGSADSVVQIGNVVGDVVIGDRTRRSAVPVMAPRLPNGFTERVGLGGRLLDALLEPAAGEGHPVVLCGPGGFGKTSMATWACHQPSVRERFPDGVLWVELGRDPSEQRLASLLSDVTALVAGIAPRVFATVPAAAEAFRDAISTRRLLLVLDDAWSSGAVDPFLDGGSQCVRLVTTRNRGLVDATDVVVDALEDEEARAVLSLDLPDDAAAHVGVLAARVGRWPLALTMLGGTLRSLVTQHGLPVAEAVSGVITELDRHGITSADQLSAVELRRGIATTLELSLADLADSAGAASVDRLRSIAAFPQGAVVPFAWLEQLWQLSSVQTRIECDRLVRRCLASASGNTGVRLHDVTREALRENHSRTMSAASAALLDGGCPLTDQLAYHLVQAGRADELRLLLLDLRYQVERMWSRGPLALEADVITYSAAGAADRPVEMLASMLRQEAHLLVGHQNRGDLALTLHTRLFCRPELFERISHVPEAVGEGGVTPLHPFPDRADNALVRVLGGHRGPVTSITCHPGGHLVATTGAYDTTVRIWDTATWTETTVISVPDAALDRVRWSPDGSYIAVVGRTDRFPDDSDEISHLFTVLIFDAGTGDEVNAFASRGYSIGTPVAIAWAPDSSSLAVSSVQEVRLWPVMGGEPARLEPSAAACVVALDWHGEHGLAASSTDRCLLWWCDPVSSPSDVVAWPHRELLGVPVRLAWRPHGFSLALSTRGGVMILDPRSQTVLWRESPVELRSCHDSRWSPDGRSLSSYRTDRHGAVSLVTWRVPPDPRLEAEPPEVVGRIHGGIDEGLDGDLVWVRSGTMIATAGAPVVSFWYPENLTERDPGTRSFDVVRWSPDGRQLAVQRHGEWASIDLDSPESPPRQELSYPFGTPPLIHPSARAGAAWLVPAMYELHPVVAFVPDGARHAVAFWFGGVKIFRAGDGEPLRTFDEPAATRWASLSFTPDESSLVSLAEDSGYTMAEIIVWDPGTGRRRAAARLSADDFQLSCTADKLAVSHHHVAVATRSGLLGLYEIDGLRRVCWIKVNGRLRDASFDPAGERLALVGDAGLYLLRVR